jgi:hypothetical protein
VAGAGYGDLLCILDSASRVAIAWAAVQMMMDR